MPTQQHRSEGISLPNLVPQLFLQGARRSEALLGEKAGMQSGPCARAGQLGLGQSNLTLQDLPVVFLMENISRHLFKCVRTQ